MSETDATLARIEAALARAGDEHVPPVGWETRVLAAAATPRRTRWWWLAAPVVASAIAVAIWLARPGDSRPAAPLWVTLAVEHGGPLVRGSTAHVGETVTATVTGGGAHHAIWIYRDDRLVLACADEVPGHLMLAVVGDYAVVALADDAALPSPHGQLDADVATAAQGGAQYRIDSLTVR